MTALILFVFQPAWLVRMRTVDYALAVVRVQALPSGKKAARNTLFVNPDNRRNVDLAAQCIQMNPGISRILSLFAVAAVVVLRPAVARADIYRCMIDGRLTFRDAACPTQPAPVPGTPIEQGCYLVDAAGWESGRQPFVVKISASGSDKYLMTEPGSTAQTSLPMRRATPDELRAADAVLRLAADSAIVLVVPKGTPNMPALPIGLYRGRNQYRDATYFFFGFLANGAARPVACPTAPKPAEARP